MRYNGVKYYYVYDVLGNVVKLLDSNGTIVAEYAYDAYGNLDSSITLTTIGSKNPYRYKGYRFDEETGLYYLNSRYYNPETGRFINADGVIDTGGILGKNMYTYAHNNPVMFVDPSGYVPVALKEVGGQDTLFPQKNAGMGSTSLCGDCEVVVDISIYTPIPVPFIPGSKVKIGYSWVISSDYIDPYYHAGLYYGKPLFPITASVGLVDNYEDAGDYKGPFVYSEVSTSFISSGVSVDPTDLKEGARAGYLGTPTGLGVTIGVDYYVQDADRLKKRW